ncbi:hypothetical protein HY479_00075 [Candidatus Uhrbacteria bacterium]|nr:hypothetical protein [Candidatus Uhrbacteria bacterium]
MMSRVRSGQSLVEILLAITVFLFGVVTLGVLYLDATATHRKGVDRGKGVAYALEGLEAVRSIRDRSFASLATGTHGLLLLNNQWTLSGTSDTQDAFTRTVQISGPDGDTKYVTSTVTWAFSPTITDSVTFTTRITNWRKVTPTTWASPDVVSSSTLTNISANAVDVEGTTLFVTTPNNAQGTEFRVYDVTNPVSPSYLGGLETGTHLFVLDAVGSRGYLASDNNPDEVKVIDVSNPASPSELGSMKLTANENVNGVFASGTIVHLVRDEIGQQATYYIYDATNGASPTLLGSMNTGDDTYDVAVRNGNPPYAFIAGEDHQQEFQIVNVADPATMGVVGSLNLQEELLAVAVSGTWAFGGMEAVGGQPEFYLFNVSDPANPSVLGTFEVNADVNRIAVWGNLVFLATASSTKEFIVLNVTNPANPTLYGSYDLVGEATDVALSVDGTYAYVSTASSTAGLYILKTGT